MTGRTHRQLALLALVATTTQHLLPVDVAAGGLGIGRAAAMLGTLGLGGLSILLGGAVPDLDLWLQRQPRLGHYCPHRGPTHSLLGVTLAGGSVAWGLARFGLPGMSYAFLLGWSFHILLDLLTPQGVSLLWPWRQRFRLLPLARSIRIQHERQLCRLALVVVLLLPLLVIDF